MEPAIVFGLCVGCLLVGLAIGLMLNSGGSAAKAETERVQTELKDYKAAVNEHFSQTADHFKTLGRNYRDLYEHMAHGSAALMGDASDAERVGFIPMEQLLAARDDEPAAEDASVVAEQEVVTEAEPEPVAETDDANEVVETDADTVEPKEDAETTADIADNDAPEQSSGADEVPETEVAEADEASAPDSAASSDSKKNAA